MKKLLFSIALLFSIILAKPIGLVEMNGIPEK